MRIRRKIRRFRLTATYSTFAGVFWALVAYEVVSHLILIYI